MRATGLSREVILFFIKSRATLTITEEKCRKCVANKCEELEFDEYERRLRPLSHNVKAVGGGGTVLNWPF